MARKRRGLSEEDRAVWDRVAQTATPLHPVKRLKAELAEPSQPNPNTVTDPRSADFVIRPQSPLRSTATPPKIGYDLAPDPMDALRAQPHQLDRKRDQKLRQGKLVPDARVDLHGMTAARAHTHLIGFILRAHTEGLRLVLVITGKGRMGDAHALVPERRGILRHAVPEWLRQPPLGPLVVQISPAHRRHGGDGAYYVYLRRRR
ncbi:MAG: Smr/MutS family protein [Pseudomonadota bacterium]